MISVAKTFSSKPRQASMAAYRQLLAENHVEEILTDVKQNKNLDRKKELPVWLPLAECFTNGVRKAEDAQPSGLYFLDIDEKGLTEQLWNKVREENLIEEFRIVYFAESAGGGTHIWAWRTPGLSIEEDIQKLASRLGVSYDSHVTDLARCCFMVSEEYVKLLDPIIFVPLTEEQKFLYAQPDNKVEQETLPQDCSIFNVQFSMSYKGIPYEKIVQALLWKLGYGDAPAEGERNTALYTMSRYLRFICDFDEQKLFQILPHWELSDHEVLSTIKSAVWFAERCLHYQLQIYGEKIDLLHNGALSMQAAKGNIRYLDALPKEFTKEDLVGLRLSNNESPVVKTIIYRWGKEGLIKKIGNNLWQKC